MGQTLYPFIRAGFLLLGKIEFLLEQDSFALVKNFYSGNFFTNLTYSGRISVNYSSLGQNRIQIGYSLGKEKGRV